MIQKKKSYLRLIFLVTVVAVAFLAFLEWSKDAGFERQQISGPPNGIEPTAAAGLPIPPPETVIVPPDTTSINPAPSSPAPLRISTESLILKAIENCLLEKSSSFKDWTLDLQHNRKFAKYVSIENFHLVTPLGERRRLQILGPTTPSARATVRWFGVDNEDLPIPIPLTEDQQKKSSAELVTDLLNQAKISRHEERVSLTSAEGKSLEYHMIDNELNQLSARWSDQSLHCEGKQCKCN